MAKKNSMNLMEAHIEKIFLILAIGFFGWVVFSRFVSTSNLSTNNGTKFKKISDMASDGSRKAQDILATMNRDGSDQFPPIEKWAGRFLHVETMKLAQAGSFGVIRDGVKPAEKRTYNIPPILPLEKAIIVLTHARAFKPVVMEMDHLSATERIFSTQQMELINADVDFVTVEAVVPFAQIRDMFRLNFAGPQVEKPLELLEPIFADVELLRSRFLTDQSWSPWEKVARLEVDQMREQSLPENMSKISLPVFDLLLKGRLDPAVQKLILQPQPYQLLDEQWLPPTQKAEQAEQDKKDLRAARASGIRTPSRRMPTRQAPRGRPAPAARSSGGSNSTETEDDEGDIGGFAPPARRSRGPSSIRSWTMQNEGIADLKEWLRQNEIIIWAHDSQVEPGGVYRYKMRVGFFNPIAGRNWTSSKDKQFNNQPILWSKHIIPDKIVAIPERTLFFPKIAGRPADRIVTVEVCRWVDGLWHKKDFRVTPGSIIGAKDKNEKTPLDENLIALDEIEVDYTTDITVLDIVAGSSHWFKLGSRRASFRNIITTDIIYLDSDGLVKRVGVDKRSWPDELNQKRSKIVKALREQKTNLLTRN